MDRGRAGRRLAGPSPGCKQQVRVECAPDDDEDDGAGCACGRRRGRWPRGRSWECQLDAGRCHRADAVCTRNTLCALLSHTYKAFLACSSCPLPSSLALVMKPSPHSLLLAALLSSASHVAAVHLSLRGQLESAPAPALARRGHISGLNNGQNVNYYTNITLGGQDFSVLIDTGRCVSASLPSGCGGVSFRSS